MKKYLLFVLTCLSISISHSQVYVPMANENHTWKQIMFGFWAFEQEYKITGDTTFGNDQYKKLYMSQEGDWDTWYYVGAVRDEIGTGKVYFHNGLAQQLLYDFSLQAGQSATIYPIGISSLVTVSSTGTTYVNGELRKTLVFDYGWYTDTWVEGVGSSQGVNTPATNFSDFNPVLTCFFIGNDLAYVNPSEETICDLQLSAESPENPIFSVFPNPCSNQLFIQMDHCHYISSYNILSLDGKKVMETSRFGETPTIDFSVLEDGVYLLQLFSHKPLPETYKIVKQSSDIHD